MSGERPEAKTGLAGEYRDATHLDARIALHAHYSTHRQGFYGWLFDRLALAPGRRVLDAGCGSGRLWTENAARVPAGCALVLADLAPGMVRAAAEQLRPTRLPLRFVAGDVQALPFPGQAFDVVIASHMLYHVPDRPRAYAEIRRVLRPGGCLYASANSRTTMRVYDDLVDAVRGPRPAVEGAGNDSQAPGGFNLEHGLAELAAAFPRVALHRYDDALLIPEPEPLVAYAAASGHLSGAQLDGFRALVSASIARDGPLRIGKAAGVFEARAD